jgi:hypothetical protein
LVDIGQAAGTYPEEERRTSELSAVCLERGNPSCPNKDFFDGIH